MFFVLYKNIKIVKECIEINRENILKGRNLPVLPVCHGHVTLSSQSLIAHFKTVFPYINQNTVLNEHTGVFHQICDSSS